jgi:hypothetical protein
MSFKYERFSVSIVGKDSADGRFRPLRTFKHQGKTLVIGQTGTEYAIVVRNHTPGRIEAVISVDGLDVLTGKKASVYARGYVIDGGSFLHLDGFRVSDQGVATFTFGDVESSYAMAKGEPSSVGVIGVAIYPEKHVPKVTYRNKPHWEPCSCKKGVTVRGIETPYSNELIGSQATYGMNADVNPSVYMMGLTSGDCTAGDLDSKGYVTTASCVVTNDGGGAHNVMPAKDLGTQFGREQESYVQGVLFERDAPAPTEVIRLFYNSYEALVAMGIPVPTMPEPMVKAKLGADPFPATPHKGYCEPPEGWSK